VLDGTETTLYIAPKLFPRALGGKRFHVIPGDENVVAYVCGTDGKLRRTVRTFADASCPATGAILASHVGSCNFVYNGSDLERNEPMQLGISLTDAGESVSLYQQIYVNNTPINSIRWN
jgi:MSHA biogenesis protein MshO